MQGQGLDEQRSRRSAASMVAAMAMTACALSTAYLMDAMQVHRVSAPEGLATLEWSLFEAPPPAPPPPKLGGGAAQERADDAPPDPEPRKPRAAEPSPDAVPADPRPTPHGVPNAAMGHGVPGPGLPNGVPHGVGKVPCPGCVGDGPVPPAIGVPKRAAAPKPVPLEALACRVCPDPDPKKLARTRPALSGSRGGANVTAFCVDEHGKAFDVRTKKTFGDASVDRIALDTVRRWRFEPMRVGGQTRKVCSSVSFHIEFR